VKDLVFVLALMEMVLVLASVWVLALGDEFLAVGAGALNWLLC
jgi:hypothetical protein